MRVHQGHENQDPDPLLASAEALGQCPAHRGLAYVVFEDLQLAEFGNRIPSLTFEIFERDGPLLLSSLMDNISHGDITADSAIDIGGFAAAGASVGEAISPILDVCPVELVTRYGQLVVRDVATLQSSPEQVVIAAEENGRALDRPISMLPPAGNVPSSISLRYYDAERDYQAGIQQSGVDAGGRGDLRLELPAVLSAVTAKTIVEAKDSDVRYARNLWSGAVMTSRTPYQPGDHFLTPDNRKWQISEIEVGLGTAQIKAKALTKHVAASGGAGVSGRHTPSADLPIGETRIVAVDLPLVAGGDPNKPVLALFAAGSQAGWKRASVSIAFAGQWEVVGNTAPPATIGITQNAMGAHHALLLDEANILDIELLNTSMSLAMRDTSPLANDAPTFWIGGEFVRVGRIGALGGKRYQLSCFSRANFSSFAVAPLHAAGAQVVLMDVASALIVPEAYFNVGQTVMIEAQGLGDTAPVFTSVVAAGLAITPLPPVHGRAVKDASGNVDLQWKRRSRLDLGWVDGVDQAQAEDDESYRIGLYADDTLLREWVVAESSLRISASELVGAGVPSNSTPTFHVQQIGRFAQSVPLIFDLN